MKRLAAVPFVIVVATTAGAAEWAPGRWQGVIDIPGRPVAVTVDLSRDANAWTGSVTMTGLGIKGAPLGDIAVGDNDVKFRIQGVLSTEQSGPALFTLRSSDASGATAATLAGEFVQAGNHAPLTLRRTGEPQVEAPRRSTPLATALEGTWTGQYEMGYPRQVTVKLANAAGAGTAEFVVVGKRTTNLPISLVTQSDRYLRIESGDTGINFEGRLSADQREIAGTFEQGPLESPLVLRRAQ